MELLLTSTYFLLFLILIRKWSFFKCEGISPNLIAAVFVLKFCFGLLIWAIYTYYYNDRANSDIFKYFDDATTLHALFKSEPLTYFKIIFGIYEETPEVVKQLDQLKFWNTPFYYNIVNDGRTMIRFNAIVYVFSMGYYHIHTLVMCFLSLTGLTALYKTFYPLVKDKSKELFVLIFLIPSVLFWGSGVLKEGLLLFGLGLLVYQFSLFLKSEMKFSGLFVLLISVSVLLLTKVYVFLLIIPGFIALLWSKFSGFKRVGLKFLIVHVLAISLSLLFGKINSDYDVLATLATKQQDFISVAKATNAGSYISIGELNGDLKSFLINSPQALINAFFRPHLLESGSPIILFAAIENCFFALFIILVLIFYKSPSPSQKPWIYFSAYFTILLCLLIGLVVPVLGAIVRYKVPLLPFLAIILLMLVDKEKLFSKIKFIKTNWGL